MKFQKEIMVLQNLRHRNVVQFYRTHKQDSNIYLIMELAEKGTLATAINEGLLGWKDKTRLAHEIARGLEYLHQEGVLHRDLKSTNVLLTRHMEAKLADCGLTSIPSNGSSITSMSSAGGRITGTLRWIAPELFETVKPLYSTKTDVYALGVVMWEMAANCTRPYEVLNNEALVVHRVKSGYRERLPDDTPTEYRKWVECCWHHDPSQRPDASKVILVCDQQEDTDDDHDALRSAAIHGVAKAQVRLGGIYEEGHGVRQNNVEAVRWYRMAADQGQDDAQVKIGTWYSLGCGVDQSDVKAAIWFTKAAEQWNADAQYNLALMYQEGQGVEQSDVEAVKWYIKAAEQGNANAQYNLGWMYKEGRGVEQSDDEAVKWFTKAAEQGKASAQYSLGWMYREEQGVEQSDVEA
ncbi:hypothetical protein BGW42_006664, partial [Actinomortierella wolfii]